MRQDLWFKNGGHQKLPLHQKEILWWAASEDSCPHIMDFSLLSPLEFFADPKNGDGRNNQPPAMRVRVDCYTKNYLSIYNKVVQAILQKGKVIYGEERKFTRTYEMDVQVPYRIYT